MIGKILGFGRIKKQNIFFVFLNENLFFWIFKIFEFFFEILEETKYF